MRMTSLAARVSLVGFQGHAGTEAGAPKDFEKQVDGREKGKHVGAAGST